MSFVQEKEVRGALTNEVIERIMDYAESHKWTCHSYKQISIYCNTDHIASIGSVNNGKGRLIVDIRGESLTIKIKLGNALSFERKEYSIKCNKDSAVAISVLLQIFGVEEGFVRTFDRTDFVSPDGIQLTIKQNCLMGDHFELERNSDSSETIDSYNRIINDLGLKLWTKEELAQAIQNDHDKVIAQNIHDSLVKLL